jgi:hypothetical protein
MDYLNSRVANVATQGDAGAISAQSAVARESIVHTLLNHHDFVTAR